MYRTILLIMVLFGLFSCTSEDNLDTVKEVDLQKYSGTWYEIARLPNSFESGLKCITAVYSVEGNGSIGVVNKGYSEAKGKYKTVSGSAKVPNADFPGRLKVSFFWPFSGNYYIIELGENYDYALVGDPSRKYLWILAREPQLDEEIFKSLTDRAAKEGFDVSALIKVDHDCKD